MLKSYYLNCEFLKQHSQSTHSKRFIRYPNQYQNRIGNRQHNYAEDIRKT
jgi:hypothetical protein